MQPKQADAKERKGAAAPVEHAPKAKGTKKMGRGYTPGQSCIQQGREHDYRKVAGKNYARCDKCGSTRTLRS